VLTRQAAVLGSPIRHSLSPVLHRAAYRALALNWSYRAIEIDVPALPGFLAGLDESWAGLSLTMPLKEAVLPLLDDVAPLAAATRSANTVVLGEGGRVGHNTDVAGIVAAVRGSIAAEGPARVSILGAGATARSAAAAAEQLGGRHLVIVARRPEAAADVARTAAGLGLSAVESRGWQDPGDALAADLVIATVPGDAAASLASALPRRPQVLLDVTYHPWPTALARAWQSAGGTAGPGSQMLLWQAVEQVALMTGRQPPVSAMSDALQAALAA
jgi:shikimate dehydrogenase